MTLWKIVGIIKLTEFKLSYRFVFFAQSWTLNCLTWFELQSIKYPGLECCWAVRFRFVVGLHFSQVQFL